MKGLNLSWEEIKKIPRVELDGLLLALQNYENIHAFDGYDDKDIAQMAKDKPEVTRQYARSKKLKRKFEIRAGVRKPETVKKTLREALQL
tara:strand:+ start:2024 stop:2293 length:270 start_codon:yes stop_codon:yes gene_type:complete